MLQANRLTIKEGTKDQTIAGQSGGRKVICSPKALHTYNEIISLAKKGNYWAVMIVKGIDGLTSGRLHQENIYIEKRKGIAYGKGAFYVVLPGVTATFEEFSDSKYQLHHITADTNFMELQKNSLEPGLWRVKADINSRPEFQENGEIEKKEYRPVVIADMASDNVRDVAIATRGDLVETEFTLGKMVNNNGFDLHHTPGEGGIVGLKKAKDTLATEKDRKVIKSAELLANTMYMARNTEGVLWYSDWGGSAVLTRALEILLHEKNKGEVIKLKDHSIFMNRPTSPDKVIKLAEKIGMTPLGKGKNSGMTPKELKGHVIHNEVTAKGVAKVAGATIGAAGAAFGLTGIAAFSAPAITTIGIVGGVVGFTGGLIHVGKTVNAGAKDLKPKQYK